MTFERFDTPSAGPNPPPTLQEPKEIGLPLGVIEQIENLNLKITSEYPVPEIGPLLERTTLAGGKRLRPTLCYLMGGVFGIDPKAIAPYGRLAEFVHSASLAHDDVLDWADRRRDKPTINAVSSNSRAILSGDFLVARVFAELSQLKAYDLIQDLSEVMEFLVYGEWLQEGSRYNTAVSGQTLLQVAQFKTASLISWCCMVPARILKMNPEVVQLCKELGVSLGIGFQLIDDVIDYDPNGEKDFARDLKNGFINMVTWELIQNNPELIPEIKAFLYGQSEPLAEWNAQAVENAIAGVRHRAGLELARAREKLELIMNIAEVPQNSYSQSLLELIDMMALRSV